MFKKYFSNLLKEFHSWVVACRQLSDNHALNQSIYISANQGHDDVMKWKRLPALLALRGEFTSHLWIPFTKGHLYAPLIYPLMTVCANSWTNRQANKDILVLIWRPCNAIYVPDDKAKTDQSADLNHILTCESHRWHTLPVYVWDSKPTYSFPSTVFLHVVRSVKRNDGFGRHGIRIFDRSSQAPAVLSRYNQI